MTTKKKQNKNSEFPGETKFKGETVGKSSKFFWWRSSSVADFSLSNSDRKIFCVSFTCSVLSGESLRFFWELLEIKRIFFVTFEIWRWNPSADGFSLPGGRSADSQSRDRPGSHQSCFRHVSSMSIMQKFSDDVSLNNLLLSLCNRQCFLPKIYSDWCLVQDD